MRSLRIAIISTDYPPLRTSAAAQLHDLAVEFVRQGHRPVVIVPGELGDQPFAVSREDDVEVVRLDAKETRAARLALRALAELMLPFAMLRRLRKSPYRAAQWDVVTWYSPPIFFAPLIYALKRRGKAKAYLILRDIFPEWALDVGVLRKGPVYSVLKAIAALQYSVSDVIGVQTPSNIPYMETWRTPQRRVEVLHNWLIATPDTGCSIRIAVTALAGRTIFAYIGNLGVAQNIDIFADMIAGLRHRSDLGFVFVGRGSEFVPFSERCRSRGLDNVLFFDEIDTKEVPGLLAQCHVGIVALHPDHKTHNIPGKFVSYMHYGLPVLARVNPGNDLAAIIEGEDVGRVYTGRDVDRLTALALELADDAALRAAMAQRSRSLGARMFSPQAAASQIAAAAAVPED